MISAFKKPEPPFISTALHKYYRPCVCRNTKLHFHVTVSMNCCIVPLLSDNSTRSAESFSFKK